MTSNFAYNKRKLYMCLQNQLQIDKFHWYYLKKIIFVFSEGAGEASADVPGEEEEDVADKISTLAINEKSLKKIGEVVNGEINKENEDVEGETNQKPKSKRKRGKGGKCKQTDPPTIPVSTLFRDGIYNFKIKM